MYKNSWIHYITKIVVDVMFYSGIAVCIFMPFITSWMLGLPYSLRSLYLSYVIVHPVNIIYTLAGICGVFTLWQLKKLFKTLLGGNPFVPENVNCFRKMAIACLAIALIFVVRLYVFTTIPSIAIVIVFALATLFCLTLKDIFKQAAHYKQENDLTV